MKLTEKFLYHACAYTTVITAIFYLCAKAFSMSEINLGFGRFFLIFAFSTVLSAAELIFNVKNLKPLIKYAIHFTSIFAIFLVAFVIIKKQSGAVFTFTSFLTALFIYAVLYVIIFGFIKLCKATSNKIDKKTSPKKPSNYSPRF